MRQGIYFIILSLIHILGNTNVNFHHELAVEQAIRNHHYEAARMVGAKSLETTRTLAVLRAYAMSLEGTMGEHLFEYPQYYGAEGLLFAPTIRAAS